MQLLEELNMEKGSLATKIEDANTWYDTFVAEAVQKLLDDSDAAGTATEDAGSTAV